MARIIVEIDDSKAALLRKKADKFGILPDQFVTASIENLIGQPEPEFEDAMRKVISKNKELYKRLARCATFLSAKFSNYTMKLLKFPVVHGEFEISEPWNPQ